MTGKDMLGRSDVVTREQALRILEEQLPVAPPPPERVPLGDALGRIVAETLRSPQDLPEFDRSTMDGYAVRSADSFGATETLPALLNVAGEIPMGVMPDRGIGKGEVMKIATGGALPAGADAVVMLEHCQAVDGSSIEIVRPVAPLENVVRAGDDIRKGEAILERGHRIRPQDLAALAGVGITRVPVHERPKVAIISTGNEIVPADRAPAPGQIRDTNSYDLAASVVPEGCMAVKQGIVRDEYGPLREALAASARECSLVLMTGGSSVGASDLTARVIQDLGPPGVLVHGIAIKPGKPLIIGAVSSHRGRVPVFGLPGHPAAVTICFDLFVRPTLFRIRGELRPPAMEGIPPFRTVTARLARSISSSPGREDHVRVALERRDGQLWARPVFGASGLISTLVKAAGTVVVPMNEIGIETGEEVEVRLF